MGGEARDTCLKPNIIECTPLTLTLMCKYYRDEESHLPVLWSMK